jgi:hypothetical protein
LNEKPSPDATAFAPSFLPISYRGQVIVLLSAFNIFKPPGVDPEGET